MCCLGGPLRVPREDFLRSLDSRGIAGAVVVVVGGSELGVAVGKANKTRHGNQSRYVTRDYCHGNEVCTYYS